MSDDNENFDSLRAWAIERLTFQSRRLERKLQSGAGGAAETMIAAVNLQILDYWLNKWQQPERPDAIIILNAGIARALENRDLWVHKTNNYPKGT